MPYLSICGIYLLRFTAFQEMDGTKLILDRGEFFMIVAMKDLFRVFMYACRPIGRQDLLQAWHDAFGESLADGTSFVHDRYDLMVTVLSRTMPTMAGLVVYRRL